jgi:hypothetical protein
LADNNFYVDPTTEPRAAIRQGISWLLQTPSQTAYLAVVQNTNLQGTIRDVLGRDVVRNLISRESTRMDGHQVILVTHHRMLYNPVQTRLVAFYPSADFLDELDAIPNITDMLVVAWMESDIRTWRTTRNAVLLGATQQARSPFHLSDRVVEAAVRGLSSSVNQSTGLANSRDRETAVQTFRILRDEGFVFDPEQIKIFLVAECGWDAPTAAEVEQVALQILQGRRLREGQRRFVPNIVDIWREEARTSGQ